MNITEAFRDKTLVITGGTGFFGSTVLKHFLTTDIGEIRIISRDEKKQDMMRHILQARYPDYAGKVQFYVGDVRSLDSVRDVMYGANYVFHAAALKEVPSCEFFPMGCPDKYYGDRQCDYSSCGEPCGACGIPVNR